MKEVPLKGGGFEQAKSAWTGRGGGSSAMACPLGDIPGGSKASELYIDRYTD